MSRFGRQPTNPTPHGARRGGGGGSRGMSGATDAFSDVVSRDTGSEDWFDQVEQHGIANFCPNCGNSLESTRFCPHTGRPHNNERQGSQKHKDPKSIIPKIPLFSSAASSTPGFTSALSDELEVTMYNDRAKIFKAGESGGTMYMVLGGTVDLLAPTGQVLKKVQEGEHFGEITLLYGGTRNATAEASGSVVVAVLDKPGLERVMRRYNCRNDIMKNAQHINYIKQWFVGNVPLFQTCAANARFVNKVALALEYTSVDSGFQVIRQGAVGTEMYFLVAGQVEVLTDRRQVAVLEQGSYFGEIAMLYGGERAATIKATMYCHLYKLTKEHLDEALDLYPDCVDNIFGTAQETRYLKEHFIKKLPLFSDMKNNAEFVFNMADALHSRSFHPSEDIVREGQSGTEMYFIARGDAIVKKNDTQVATLTSGNFFGEVSLLYDEPRTATIQATNYVHTYILQQDAFEVIAVAFPEWWEGLRRRGDLFSRVDRTREATATQGQGLALPSISRGGPAPRQADAVQRLQRAQAGDQQERDRLRQEISNPERRPTERTVEEELQELRDERLCLICCAEEKCMIVIPCGHISACEECSKKLNQCPQCRGAINSLYKAVGL